MAALVSSFGLEVMEVYGWIPRPVTWIADLALALAGLAAAATIIRNRKVPRAPTHLFVLLILAHGVGMMAAGSVSPFQWALGLRQSLQFILLFYVILTYEFDERFLMIVIKLLLVIAFVCCPTSAVERYVLRFHEDLSGGLLTGGAFAIFGMGSICLATAYGFRFGWLRWETIVVFSVFLTFLMAESKVAYLFLPVALFIQFVPDLWNGRSKRWIGLFVVLGLSYGFSLKYAARFSVTMGVDLPRMFHLTEVTERPGLVEIERPNTMVQAEAGFVQGRAGRITAVVYAWNHIRKSPVSILFGKGPGSASESYFAAGRGDLELGRISLHQSQAAKSLVEFGVLGTLLFLSMFAVLYARSFRVRFHDAPFWQATAVGYQGVLSIYVMAMAYNQVWAIKPVSLIFWFLSACMELRRAMLVRNRNRFPARSTPLRVLIIGPSFAARGGISNYYRLFSKRFESDRYTIRYFSTGSRNLYISMSALRQLSGLWYFVSDFVRLIFVLAFARIDLVHANASMEVKSLVRDGIYVLAAKLFGKHLVVNFRGWLSGTEIWVGKHAPLLFRTVFGGADVTVALGHPMKRVLVGWGWPDNAVAVSYTMFDESVLPAPEPAGNGPPKILFLGIFLRDKGVLEALESFRIFLEHHPDARLIMAGDGPLREEIESRVRRPDLAGKVSLTGFLTEDEKYRALASCQVFLFPTYDEGCPNSVIEALASGLAVVSRPVGAIPDLVVDGLNGFLVPGKDPSDFASALENLYKDPARLARMRAENRRQAFEKYASNVIVAGMVRLYDHVTADERSSQRNM